jgi:hypothetical protein
MYRGISAGRVSFYGSAQVTDVCWNSGRRIGSGDRSPGETNPEYVPMLAPLGIRP